MGAVLLLIGEKDEKMYIGRIKHVSQISKNIVSYSGAIIAQKIVSFFYFTLIARTLGPGLAGTFFLAFSLTQLFAAFVDLGFGNLLIREVAQDRERSKSLFQHVWGVKLILSALGFIGVMASTVVLQYPSPVMVIAVFAGIALVLDSLSAINYSTLRGHQVLGAESIGIVLYQLVLAGTGTAVLVLTQNVVFLAVANVLASGVFFVYSVRSLKRLTTYVIKPHFDRHAMLDALRHSLPFAFIMLFGRLYTQTDIIMLSKIGCSARDCIRDIGLYTTAVKATLVVQSVPLSLMASVYPALSESFAHDRERFKSLFANTVRYMISGMVGILLVFWVFGERAVSLVWGSEYIGSVASLNTLLFGSVFVVASFPCAAALNAGYMQHRYAKYTLVGLMVNIVVNVALIPYHGLVGAALASALGSAVLLTLSLNTVRGIVHNAFQDVLKLFLKISGVGIVSFFITHSFTAHVPFLIGVLVCAIVYGILLVAVRVIRVEEVRGFVKGFIVPNLQFPWFRK